MVDAIFTSTSFIHPDNTTFIPLLSYDNAGFMLSPGPGWNFHVAEVFYGGIVVELAQYATLVSNYPFIDLPDYSYDYIYNELQAATQNGFELVQGNTTNQFSYYRATSE